MSLRESIFKISQKIIVPSVLKFQSNTLSVCFHRVSDEYSPGYPPMKVEDFEKLIHFFS